MRWHAQRADDVVEELLHREDVEVQPVARDCRIGGGIGGRSGGTDVEVLEIGGDGGAQTLLLATGE